MKKLRTLLFLIIVGVSLNSNAQVIQARVYFVPWDVLTRASLNEAQVRRMATAKLEVSDRKDAESLADWLSTAAFGDKSAEPLREVRLVVDVTYADGQTRTFIANRFALMDERGGRQQKIDSGFRRHCEDGVASKFVNFK